MCGDYYIGGREFDTLSDLIGYYTSWSDLLKGERLQHPVPPPEVGCLILYVWVCGVHIVNDVFWSRCRRSRIVSMFTSIIYEGGMRNGVKGLRTLFKNVVYGALLGVSKSTLLLVGREGVTQKSTLCTLLIMLIILDDP